jgi:hypothetical protein
VVSPAQDAEQAAEAEVSGGEASVLVTGYAAAVSLGFRVIFDEEEIEGLEIVAVPDRVGVGRARFRLPEGVSSGSHAVRIRIADATSNAVRISLD